MRTFFLLIGLVWTLNGCALLTEGNSLPTEPMDAGEGHPASYSADPMNFRKETPDRSDSETWDFYFKHCSRNSEQPYYSKTSYDCTGPY